MRRIIKFLLCAAVIVGAVCFMFGDAVRRQIDLYNYPIAFTDLISAASFEYGVPEELIYAVILTESSFEPNAHSAAGAKGLMQLMDITNEDVCKRSGKPLESDIFDPAVNIDRGVYYLAYLYRQFGTWRETIAAYNAGIGRVKGWLGDPRYSDDGITLTDIPIDETRAYVSAVMAARDKYTELYFSK